MPKESSIKEGDVFGRLTVIEKIPKCEYDPRSVKRTLFWVACECGTDKIVDAGNLKKGLQSCGCLRSEQAREKGRSQRTEMGYIRNYYGSYKRGARFRNREFSITLEDFLEIVKSPCKYCGREPTIRETKNVVGLATPINGVDRVDSSAGYNRDNCVPCCDICNKMKLDMGVEDFLNHCSRIVDHTELTE